MPGKEYYITPSESEFPDVEDGKYRAVIEEIAVEDGQWGEMLRWKFCLLDEPYPEVRLSSLTSPKLTPKSKLWPWVVAMGYEPQLGVEFNIMELEGQECYVMVERKPDKNDPSKVYSNVTKIVPPPKAPGTGMAPAPAPAAHAPVHAHAPAPAARPAPAPAVARPGAPAPRPAAAHAPAPMARPAGAPRPSAPPPRRQAVAGGQEDIPF